MKKGEEVADGLVGRGGKKGDEARLKEEKPEQRKTNIQGPSEKSGTILK